MKLLYLLLASCLIGNSYAMNPGDCYRQLIACKEEAFNSAKDFNDFRNRRSECKNIFYECKKRQNTALIHSPDVLKELREFKDVNDNNIEEPKIKGTKEGKTSQFIKEVGCLAGFGLYIYTHGYVVYNLLGLIYGKK